MPLVTFNVIKPKTTIQLDLPLDTSFSDIKKHIADYLHLDMNKVSKYGLRFICRKYICNENQTLESLNITPDDTITVFIMPEILRDKDEFPEVKQIFSLKKLPAIDVYYPKELSDLREYLFSYDDCIYALAYQGNCENAADLIKRGITQNENYIKYIDIIYSEKSIQSYKNGDFDNLILNDIEIAKIIADYRSEDVEVKIGALITEYLSFYTIKDKKLECELQTMLSNIKSKKPSKIEEILKTYKKMNRKVIISLPRKLYRLNIIGPLNISSVKKRLNDLMDEIPSMSPNNYVNPFEETFDLFMKVGVSEKTREILEMGRRLNYEQLKFASCHHNKFDEYYNDVIKFINMADGVTENVDEVVSQLGQKIISTFNKITEMTPQNFKNPFLQFYNEMGNMSLNIINIQYLCTLNYDQLKFIHDCCIKKILPNKNNFSIKDCIELLIASDGNIDEIQEYFI